MIPAGRLAESWKAMEAREQPVVEHRLGALADLLAGLGDHHQGSGPLVAQRHQAPCRADPGGHVGVVPAGVHDSALDAREAGASGPAGEGEAGLLLDRERVHVGAQHHDRPVAVAEQGDDPGPADAGGHVEAEPPRLLGQQARRSGLLHAELGILVQVSIQSDQVRQVLAYRLIELLGERGGGDRRSHKHECQQSSLHQDLPQRPVAGTSSITSSRDSKWG
jgi:hypothetical protein